MADNKPKTRNSKRSGMVGQSTTITQRFQTGLETMGTLIRKGIGGKRLQAAYDRTVALAGPVTQGYSRAVTALDNIGEQITGLRSMTATRGPGRPKAKHAGN